MLGLCATWKHRWANASPVTSVRRGQPPTMHGGRPNFHWPTPLHAQAALPDCITAPAADEAGPPALDIVAALWHIETDTASKTEQRLRWHFPGCYCTDNPAGRLGVILHLVFTSFFLNLGFCAYEAPESFSIHPQLRLHRQPMTDRTTSQ